MVTVRISRSKLYPEVARPGPAWRWMYHYAVDGGDMLDYGTRLASLRYMLRHNYGRDVQIVKEWD